VRRWSRPNAYFEVAPRQSPRHVAPASQRAGDRPTAPEAQHVRRSAAQRSTAQHGWRGRRQRYPLQPKQRGGTPRTQRVRAHVCGRGRPHRLAEAPALRAVRRDARAVRVVRLKAVVAHKPETHGPLACARLKKGGRSSEGIAESPAQHRRCWAFLAKCRVLQGCGGSRQAARKSRCRCGSGARWT
jgi:hypothetical protein